MHLVYIDDSKDEKSICFSALLIPADQWMACLDHLIGVRKAIRGSDGIYNSIELHATDWLGGRGNVAPMTVPKGARARLFNYVLSSIALMPGVQIINAHSTKAQEMTLFERLLNRIHKNVAIAGSRAVIFSDEGKNYDALLRRLRRFNPIPSHYGQWPGGRATRNLPLERILEDVVYRDSRRSYFVQAADFCAFSLLRYEAPTPAITKLGLDRSFEILKRVLVTQAFASDPKKLGIVRA